MTSAQLAEVMGNYPDVSTTKDFINKYVHSIYLSPSNVVYVSCDFNYATKKPIQQVHYCTSASESMIVMAPAEDTAQARMYYDKHIDINAIQGLECYSPVQNEYIKQAIQKAKELKAAGKKPYDTTPKDYQAIANSKNYPPASA